MLKVFIDGIDQRESNLVPFDVPAEQVEAIEIFTGADVPTRYNTMGTACGMVNIWRRVLR